ncbi:MAG: hypothetical protein M3P89_03385, partial [Actinomycetota bacterium]|nr:hypothetical protein [Actinomycetota bacterium]
MRRPLWAHRLVCTTRDDAIRWPTTELVTALARKKLAWTVEEVQWALRLTLVRGEYDHELPARARLPLSAAERLPRADLARLRKPLADLRPKPSTKESWLPAADARRLCRRVDALLLEPRSAVTVLPPSVLHDGDTLGPALRAEMGAQLNGPGVPALLVHVAGSTGPRPSGKWRAEGHRLLSAAEDGRAVVRAVLERTLRHREVLVHSSFSGGAEQDMGHYVWIHDSTARLLRGLILLAGDLEESWVTPLLSEILEYAGGGLGGSASSPRDLVVVNAVVAALGRRADAVPYLSRVQSRLKNRTALKGIAAALDAAADRSGLTVGELLESTVPIFGLDADGRRTEPIGAYRAVVAVAPPGDAALTFRSDADRELAAVPAAVRT